MPRILLLLSALLLLGCPADDLAGADAAADSLIAEAAASDTGSAPPKWSKGQPDTTRLKVLRGLRVARGIIHAHSLHSHDACDGAPTINGKPNEPCLQDLKDGLCTTRMDFIMLTEHISSLSTTPFDELLLMRAGDQAALKGGAKVANRIKCKAAGSFSPLMLIGAELSRSMPVGLERHVAGAASELKKIYGSSDVSLDAKLKAAGAVLLEAHTESKKLADLKAHALDGIEVYNLHANLDPNIRKAMGLKPLGYLDDIAPFTSKDPLDPQPDLAFIGFFLPSEDAMGKWTKLLALRPTAGVLGTDAHRNVMPVPQRDGERMDSYRRMFRWFSNHVRVKQVTFDAVKQAVRLGRGYMVFEVLGTPQGFDFHATAGGKYYELGATVKVADTPLLKLTLPTVLDLAPSAKQPKIEARLLRVDATGATTEVAKGSTGQVFHATKPGAYRVEVTIVPEHLRPWLGKKPDKYIKQVIWIYSNPIYVQ